MDEEGGKGERETGRVTGRIRAELRLEVQKSRGSDQVRSGLHPLPSLARRLVHAEEVVGQLPPAFPVSGIPAGRRETVLGVEGPAGRLGELEAVLDRVFQEAVETARRRRGLSPDEVLTEEKSLLAEPEDQLILDRAPLVAVALGPVVEDEGALRLQSPEDLPGDREEEALVPLPPVPLTVAVLRLTVV